MNFYLLLSLSLLFARTATPFMVENPCNIMFPIESGDWGESLLWLPEDKTIIGIDSRKLRRRITRKPEGGYTQWFRLDAGILDSKDLVWIGHWSQGLLKVFDHEGSRYLVATNSSVAGIWISAEEIERVGGKVVPYASFLHNDKSLIPEDLHHSVDGATIGVNLPKSCLNLRAGPGTSYAKIECLPANGDKPGYNKLIIKKWENAWAFVEVAFYEKISDCGEMDDCCYNLWRWQQGWVKALDDSGPPNIWFSVTEY